MTELLAGPAQILTSIMDNALLLKGIMVAIGAIIGANIFNSLVKTATQLMINIALTGILGKKKKQEALAAGTTAAFEAGSSAAKVPVIGAILGAAAIISMLALVGTQIAKIGDLSSPALGKTQVSTKEGGLFELSKNDDLVAFPGASKALSNKNQPVIINQPSAPVQQAPQIDYDKMAQAMSRVKVQTNLDGVRVSSELQKAPLGMATRKI
jgi:hypothetical protein